MARADYDVTVVPGGLPGETLDCTYRACDCGRGKAAIGHSATCRMKKNRQLMGIRRRRAAGKGMEYPIPAEAAGALMGPEAGGPGEAEVAEAVVEASPDEVFATAMEEIPAAVEEEPIETAAAAVAESRVNHPGGLPWKVGGEPDWGKDVRWVYAEYNRVVEQKAGKAEEVHLERASRPAPSEAAVGMMYWAAGNRTAFYKEVAAKVMVEGEAKEEEGEQQELQIGVMRKVLRRFVERKKEWEREEEKEGDSM